MPSKRTSRRWLEPAALVSLLLFAGCATAPPADSGAAAAVPRPPAGEATPASAVDEVKVALLSGRAITVEQLRAEMARRGGSLPGAYATAEQRRALLDEMVRARAIAETARREGLDRDPELSAAFERLLVRRYLDLHLEPELDAISVSDEEIERFYREREEEFRNQARSRAAWLLVEVPERATEAQRAELAARAETVRRAALALPAGTRNFGALAIELSDDTATRYTGGEIGWISAWDLDRHRLGRALVEGVLALSAPGEVSPVLRVDRGFAVAKLVELEPAAPTPLEKLRAGLRNRLLREKREAATAAFHERLLGQFEVWIDADALERLGPAQPLRRDGAESGPPALPPG